MFYRLGAAALGAAVGACTVVSSTGYLAEPKNSIRKSTAVYSLPRTMFEVQTAVLAGPDPNVPVFDQGRILQSIMVTKKIEADPRARLVARYEPSPLADDDLQIMVGGDGLLSRITSHAKDRTGDIILNLAELVFTLGTGGGKLPEGVRSLPAGVIPKAPSFVASYDPLDPDDVLATRRGLAKAGFCIVTGELAISHGPTACPKSESDPGLLPAPPVIALPETVVSAYSSLPGRKGESYAPPPPPLTGDPINPSQVLAREPGVYYRQPVPVPVRIYQRKGSSFKWEPLFAGSELLFDKAEAYQLDIDRAAFVQKDVTVQFSSGALAQIDIKKPSELYELSTIGLKIAKLIVAAPIEALNVNKSRIDAETSYIEAQTKLLEKQNTLLKKQTELVNNGQRSLVRRPVNLVDTGARALGAAETRSLRARSGTDVLVCTDALGAGTGDCRMLIERSRGF
jgi:hypothetical protein